MSPVTASPVVYPRQRDHCPPRLTPDETRAVHDMLGPVIAAMEAAGMTDGGLAVTAGPHNLDVDAPGRGEDQRSAGKLAFAREVLRARLTADGTLWLVPASTLLCLLQPVPGHPGTYQGLAVALFGAGEPGNLIDARNCSRALVEPLPLPAAE